MHTTASFVSLLLACANLCEVTRAQDAPLKFTSGVTSPAPIPGQPFKLTWTGGDATAPVYIIRNYLFPDTPNQNIDYITTGILSNAPNNGSWTYNVPIDIFQGRYTFSIGINPLLHSDETGVFTILSSQTSKAPAGPSPSTSAASSTYSWNGCGLAPLPDYTYTGYQPPCTLRSDGQIVTVFPVVPVASSAAFYGTSYLQTPSITKASSSSATTSTPVNTAFATGVFAQALQCPTPVTPTTTKVTASGATTIFSLVNCAPTSAATANSAGVCHTSGYSTYSVSGSSSVCCPNGWATTPLNSELFCFTSMAPDLASNTISKRQIETQTLEASPNPLLAISGIAITKAGVVTAAAQSTTSGSPSTSGKGSSSSSASGTSSAATPTSTKSAGTRIGYEASRMCGFVLMAGAFCLLM